MSLLLNTVHQGDCIDQLQQMRPGSADLVFADPPFNIGYEYDVYDDGRSRHEYLRFSRQWMSAVARVLKPTGTFWLAIGDEYAAELKLIAQDELRLVCRSWVIWYYTFGVNCVRGFSRSHTHLFHFVKDAQRFTFNGQNPAVRVASARQLVYADGRANSKGRLPDNTWILRPQDAPAGGFSPMHDTWYYARVAGTFSEREGFHGCQMPEQLLGRIIRLSSNPAELVVDPFAGSGTTLAVAKKLGRQWLGIELSADYVKRVRGRLDRCRAGDPLDGSADPVRSAPSTAKGKKRGRFRNGRPILTVTRDTENEIVNALKESSKNCSTDLILCDPELNERFASACRCRDLPGDESTWNRLLLRLRKAGKLPKLGPLRTSLSAASLDAHSAASEAAMQLLSLDYGLTLDDILCSPHAAAEFDRLAAQFGGSCKASALEYRWAALSIRKRAKRSRALARERCQGWRTQRLPRPTPLESFTSKENQHQAVYIVRDDLRAFYVGETRNLAARVEQLKSELWAQFGPRSLIVIEMADQAMRHGLQSMLIGRTKPVLNSILLRPDYDEVKQ